MSGAGHLADMNNRLNHNRVRFKESNRGTIHSDTVPNAT